MNTIPHNCGECDSMFDCHKGKQRCLRMPLSPVSLEQAARVALEAIESGRSFDYMDNLVGPLLREALAANPLYVARRSAWSDNVTYTCRFCMRDFVSESDVLLHACTGKRAQGFDRKT